MNKLFKKNLLMISITIFIAASAIFICYKKVQHQSQTESQSSSQTNPITSQYVIEKYSETVKNVKSFKYKTEYSTNFNNTDPKVVEKIGAKDLVMKKIQDGTLSIEPFSLQSNIFLTDTKKSQNLSNYVNEKNILYYKIDNQSWKSKESSQSISEAIDSNKKYIANDKFLDALKNVVDDLILEEQGDNYILTFIGTDDKFISLLSEFDSDLPPALTDLKKSDGKYLNFRLTINKSTFEPIEISFKASISKHNQEGTDRKIEAKQTFSEINTAKVEIPEDVQYESQSESQSKLPSPQDALEKFSEVINDVESFKYLTEFTIKSTRKNTATGEIMFHDHVKENTREEGSFSTEPFAILSNRTSEFSNYTMKRIQYENKSDILYQKDDDKPWRLRNGDKNLDSKADRIKSLIANPLLLEFLKGISDNLKIEEQGNNYILSYSGNDNNIIKALNGFDRNLYIFNIKEINLINVNLKIILRKNSYEPIEISFTSESFNTSSAEKITRVEAKRTFSDINNTKVEQPEGIQ